MIKYYIILVNYKKPDLTVNCIKSLESANCPRENIIVVDNFSNDNSVEILSKEKGIVFIESKENNGFSSGNNLGIDYALEHGADCVVLLNNDTEVADNFIDEFIFKADLDNVYVPKILYYHQKDTISYAGGFVDWDRGNFDFYGTGEKDQGQYDELKEVEFGIGCCMLIPTSIIKEIGKLPEEYFMYAEDADYSLNLIKHNKKIVYNPKAVIWHMERASTGNNSDLATYYTNRNRFYIINKYDFSLKAKAFVYSTRLIKYLLSCFNHTNDYLIKIAYKDYKLGNMGKIDLSKRIRHE